MDYVKVPETNIPVTVEADVVVIGGGPAGVGAAVRAARGGAKTYLIERCGSLGGMMTNAFMSSVAKFGPLAMEIMERLEAGGFTRDAEGDFPGISQSYCTHNGKRYWGQPDMPFVPYFVGFDQDMMACVMSDLCEEAGVVLSFRNNFVDCVVEDGTLKAVIVENPGGRQAVEGKVFIDCTGRGDVVARAGCPYHSQGNDDGWGHMAAGLMWKMSNVDLNRLLEYERSDPGLVAAMEKAKVRGEMPHYHPKRTREWMHSIGATYNGWHTGHPRLEFMPWCYDGDLQLWSIPPYDLKLNPSESVKDATTCEIQCRKEIREELFFLKKYVPGFENANLAGMASLMGLREGRHPLGEYVYTVEDQKTNKKFDDCALIFDPHMPITADGKGEGALEMPYRMFQAKGVDNLLLGGDNLSIHWTAYWYHKGFGKAMSFGEVAGINAAKAVTTNTKVKEVKVEPYVVDLRYHPENQRKYPYESHFTESAAKSFL